MKLRQRGYGIVVTMSPTFTVRRCRMRDISPVSDLLRVCWHAAYDGLLEERQALRAGRKLYSRVNLGLWIAHAFLLRSSTVLVATDVHVPVGHALAQRDGAEIVLYSLYVHPAWQRKGIGSALLEAVITDHAGAQAIRLEVLRDNVPAIRWYEAKGFQAYGETANATGTADVASVYMDKALDGAAARSAAR